MSRDSVEGYGLHRRDGADFTLDVEMCERLKALNPILNGDEWQTTWMLVDVTNHAVAQTPKSLSTLGFLPRKGFDHPTQAAGL